MLAFGFHLQACKFHESYCHSAHTDSLQAPPSGMDIFKLNRPEVNVVEYLPAV